MALLVSLPPCVLHEDEHILVANKPAGINTHSPSPYAGEGLYDWLRHREPRWSQLAIIHRLDKVTSGLSVFAKTSLANRSLTDQFSTRLVRKKYLFLASAPLPKSPLLVKSHIARAGEKYVAGTQGDEAETRFQSVGARSGYHLIEAEPLTGRTHQIRVHAQLKGVPILGDTLYGGESFGRVCLHSAELSFRHPASGDLMSFRSEPAFFDDPALALRQGIIDPLETDAFRLVNGAADDLPGVYLEKWGGRLLSSGEAPLSAEAKERFRKLDPSASALYHRTLVRQIRKASADEAAPALVAGEAAPAAFPIKENGAQFEISFAQGYSVGLFLDQRDNRRRLLRNHIGAGFPIFEEGLKAKSVLNTFAYTCGFSVCAALAGATTTSLDLSRKYLDWGRRNFQLNGLDPAAHDFIYGDVFDWVTRLEKKGRLFDVILLDPPTFSHAKQGRAFKVETDFGKLVRSVLPLLRPGGILFASTNAHRLSPEAFLEQIRTALAAMRRAEAQSHYVPQPLDFPVSREEPAYLKTVWIRVK